MKIIENHPDYEIYVEAGDPYPMNTYMKHYEDWEPIILHLDRAKNIDANSISDKEIIQLISNTCMVDVETVEQAYNDID